MAEWQAREPDLDRVVLIRLTLAERIQHWVLIAIFVTLILTGIPLLFPAEVIGPIFGSAFPIRTWVHRIAGALLGLLAGYHVLYVLFSPAGRRNFARMAPRVQDWYDLVHHVRYQLGRTEVPPQFDKFDPFEKIEYFAVVWGSAIMVVTGLMMWFFEATLRVLPKWGYDLVLIVHSYEALLAFLAIILWHLYNVHLKPGVFPMSTVWLDGKVTLREIKQHHPRQYQRWLRRQQLQPRTGEKDTTEA